VHALMESDEVRMWVRDASLGDQAQRRLVAELRERLRNAGQRLAELTVNGERIYLLERSLSWRSKP
jgi:hypothetical protein